MNICCCSNPACQVNGCQNAAIVRNKLILPIVDTQNPVRPLPDLWQKMLTEDDVRRIVREEMNKLKEQT